MNCHRQQVAVGLVLEVEERVCEGVAGRPHGMSMSGVMRVRKAGLQLGYVWGCGRSPGPRVPGLHLHEKEKHEAPLT